jgi:hypothetical protein
MSRHLESHFFAKCALLNPLIERGLQELVDGLQDALTSGPDDPDDDDDDDLVDTLDHVLLPPDSLSFRCKKHASHSILSSVLSRRLISEIVTNEEKSVMSR